MRVVRACFDEHLETVLAVSQADTDSMAARLADHIVVIGPPAAAESYLSVERVITVCWYPSLLSLKILFWDTRKLDLQVAST